MSIIKRKKKVLRVIAVFLLLNFVTQIILPTAVWALTSGPTAPEFSSFEPIDTTDMVNPATGDMTYNIPLLEVPGPEGGYPLALSYHAGISPEQEASWVGLGWTLNPGAINRVVNGFADDFSNIDQAVKDYWDGGSREIFGVGVGYCGIVGVGVDWGYDTYQGFGIGMNVTAGFSDKESGVGVSLTVGSQPFGGNYATVGFHLSKEIGKSAYQSSLSTGISFQGSDMNVYAGGGISAKGNDANFSILSAGISSGSSTPNLHVGGASSNMSNNNAGKISSNLSSFGVTMPLPYGFTLDLSYSYERYYSETADLSQICGSLYLQDANSPVFHTMDSYVMNDLEDPNHVAKSPEKGLGASFPAYDMYQVSAQGLGGALEPTILSDQYLFRRNIENVVTYDKVISSYPKVQFRFLNDFSGNLLHETNNDISVTGQFSLLKKYNSNKTADPRTYNSSSNRIGGSKHVEWFTNEEIQTGRAYKRTGFISAYSQEEGGYASHELEFIDDVNNKTYHLHNQIGGFMVTNESGVTYHYAKPVYAYGEGNYAQSYDSKNVLSTHQYFNKQPYAYTWLLTAITGPDYIDRGEVGLDDSDWGYWVKFDHGKWLNDYKWRNPIKDMKKDIDKIVNTYSYGIKQIYYLDAISTRTHTALFVKDIRNDSKDVNRNNSLTGEFIGEDSLAPLLVRTGNRSQQSIDLEGDAIAKYFPQSLLKLSKILLFSNNTLKKTLNTLRASDSKQFDETFIYTLNKYTERTTLYESGSIKHISDEIINIPISKTSELKHLSNNVIDVNDFENLKAIESSAYRVIDMNTDYSLCEGTENSFENASLYQKYPDLSNKLGKLTLTSIKTSGKGGVSIIPATLFSYNNNPKYDKRTKDNWGYCRGCNETDTDCDYTNNPVDNLAQNPKNARTNIEESFAYTDAWSLSNISSPLGANITIDYESDTYNKVSFYDKTLLRISKVEQSDVPEYGEDPGFLKLYLYDQNAISYLQIGDKVNAKLLTYNFTRKKPDSWDAVTTVHSRNFGVYALVDHEITQIGSDYIIVTHPKIINWERLFIEKYNIGTKEEHNWTEIYVKTTFGGFLELPETNKEYLKYGGGIRVKSISITNTNNISSSTNYNYMNGTTSYEPDGFEIGALNSNFSYDFRNDGETEGKLFDNVHNSEALRELSKIALTFGFNKIIANARELPGPNVFYKNVDISETINGENLSGKKSLEFIVPELNEDLPKNDIDRVVMETSPSVDYKVIRFNNFGNRPGSLKSVTVFNGQNIPLVKTTNNYLFQSSEISNNSDYVNSIANKFNNQGVLHQRYYERRNGKLIISERIEYPNILLGSKTENYQNGLVSESRNVGFDFITGEVNKSLNTDSYGNSYLTCNVAAYEQYSGMGLKIHNIQYKNMLTQDLATYVFKTNGTNWDYSETDLYNLDKMVSGLLSANYQTWTNTPATLPVNPIGITFSSESNYYNQAINNIYKKDASYTWEGLNNSTLQDDGTSAFNVNNQYNKKPTDIIDGNYAWLKTGEYTLFDGFSHVLEVKDLYGKYSCSKVDPDHKQVIASATNASYNLIAYSGAEYDKMEAGVNKNDGVFSDGFKHTGKRSLLVPSNKKGFSSNFSVPKKTAYRASVWVYVPNDGLSNAADAKMYYKINNGAETLVSTNLTQKAGGWYLISMLIPSSETVQNIEIGCKNVSNNSSVYFDDFRAHPLLSTLNSFVYDQTSSELIAILDNDNFFTRFEYNAIGKLVTSFREQFSATGEKKVIYKKYNYKH